MIQKTNIFDRKGNVKNVKDIGGEVLESETKEKTYGLKHVIIPTAILLLYLYLSQYYPDSVYLVMLIVVGFFGFSNGFSFIMNRSKKH